MRKAAPKAKPKPKEVKKAPEPVPEREVGRLAEGGPPGVDVAVGDPRLDRPWPAPTRPLTVEERLERLERHVWPHGHPNR